MVLMTSLMHAPAGVAHESCTACHVSVQPQAGDASLQAALPDLCIMCHPDRVGGAEHVINVAVISVPRLPLPLLNGQLSCTTCHDPHSNVPALVRYERSQLCSACHNK